MIKHSHVLFIAENFHSAECGVPPSISDEKTATHYHGYFVNRHGEQFVISIDRDEKTAILRGGDLGWETEVPISAGSVRDVILGNDELAWLNSCWLAACGQPLIN